MLAKMCTKQANPKEPFIARSQNGMKSFKYVVKNDENEDKCKRQEQIGQQVNASIAS